MNIEGRSADGHSNVTDTGPAPHLIRDLAKADHKDVIALIQELVRVPTRGGFDRPEPLVSLVEAWLNDRGLLTQRLQDPDSIHPVGIICDIVTGTPGPKYVLNACLDTAPFGNEDKWLHSPTSGELVDGWLYGRGAADSKAAVAIFMHIATHLRRQTDTLRGTLTLLFDADEHTGRFGGVKRYFADNAPADVKGVMIGYPGIAHLVVGGRGFLRAELNVIGEAGHTGSQRSVGDTNAIEGAAELIRALSAHQVPGPVDPESNLSPKLTVTGVRGGESFSIVPDQCTVDVDIRLTNSFDLAAAQQLIADVVERVDTKRASVGRTTIFFHESWPAYLTEDRAPIRLALTRAAERQLANPVTAKAAGPSNIGNYLAKLGISVTAGLGVRYENLHGTNERIDTSTIPQIQATYHQAVTDLLDA